jgi:hypothetical protein
MKFVALGSGVTEKVNRLESPKSERFEVSYISDY